MKFSENWLRQWVNPSVSTDELVEQLTMLGLEVDEVIPAAGDFTQVVVAEIISIEKHPDADKLNVCQVDTGAEENLQIVCGAPNARAGLKAPLAMIGAVLPGNFKIKKSKLRGLESNGMLCSNVELGLSDDHSGLLELPNDAPIGADIREYFQLNDSIIDIDLTPNRADCFCVKGIAIDVACLNEIEVKTPENTDCVVTHSETLAITLAAQENCPVYLNRIIQNIDNNKQTPLWMQEKLRRSGIRSIHPVVDVTNYVMLELGQPMHGFDKTAISGCLHVKMAEKGEKFILLDGKEVTLDESFLMIADEKHYLAIAGVMGGLDSGVTEKTTDIVLESAYFNPSSIMGKSRDIGLFTESALRFERGVDPQLQHQAMQRATELIVSICGGEVGEITTASIEKFIPSNKDITLTEDKLQRVLGFKVDASQVESILIGLQMKVSRQDASWLVRAPSSRFDINIEEDLIEEVVRLIGYDKMPSENLSGESVIMQSPEEIIPHHIIKQQMLDLGYQEAINYSFVSEKLLQTYGLDENSIALKNPLTEDFAVMRTSLLPGMVETIKYNLRRQNDSLRMFETGHTFHQRKNIREDDKIIAIMTGKRYPESWCLSTDNVDFYDCKGDLEALLNNTKKDYLLTSSEHEFLHSSRQANVEVEGKIIGWIGQIHPETCRRNGIKKDIYAYELYINSIKQTSLPSFQDISKYPSVRRDIALVVDDEISYQKIKDVIEAEMGEYLTHIFVFDKYQGENIGTGKRSLAIGMVLQQNNSTFEDKEVDKLMSKMVLSIKQNFTVEIRGH